MNDLDDVTPVSKPPSTGESLKCDRDALKVLSRLNFKGAFKNFYGAFYGVEKSINDLFTFITSSDYFEKVCLLKHHYVHLYNKQTSM